jgi:hypothetical protein
MNQSDPGWRKRQIALDKKAENARELGLDYNKTIIEMAREAGLHVATDVNWMPVIGLEYLEAFAALVRADLYKEMHDPMVLACKKMVADEREACERVAGIALLGADLNLAKRVLRAIRARGQA